MEYKVNLNYARFINSKFEKNSASNGGAIFVNNPLYIDICCNCENQKTVKLNEIELNGTSCEDHFIQNTYNIEEMGYGLNYASFPLQVIMTPDINISPLVNVVSDSYLDVI